MTILQGISQSMKTLAGSNNAEDFSRMGAVLAQLKGKIREEMQAATAGDITKILKKLEAGQSLTPEEKDNVGLWVVGDAVGYTKMENDFQHWLTEFKRLGGALEAYEIQDKSPQMLMEMHGLLEDAVRVAADLANFLEKKERVERFSEAINNLTTDDTKLLGEILKSMLTRSDM